MKKGNFACQHAKCACQHAKVYMSTSGPLFLMSVRANAPPYIHLIPTWAVSAVQITTPSLTIHTLDAHLGSKCSADHCPV